ncbi:MAG: 4-hydroxyproline epimerase [Enterobacterales bacterium]|jgi:4-hydroxyproline epimerase
METFMSDQNPLQIIDSHTGGEPTRTIVSGGPDLGKGSMAERKTIFASDFDHLRRSLILEPRGSSVMVGALLCEPVDPENTAGVIFFNNAAYLGMCGHGTIGLVVTLYHLGKIDLGTHIIETCVGNVKVELLSATKARVENVASYRFAKAVTLEVDSIGKVTGDIAWGGNWFFLIKEHGQLLSLDNTPQLLNYASKVLNTLDKNNIRAANGELIDHVELFAEPDDINVADSKNFVLCPGHEYDRSPCGTGTSAKLACLYEDKEIVQNQLWKQQSIIGSIFEGYVKIVNEEIIPVITGDAFVTLKSTVIRQHDDPFKDGF